MSNFDVKENKVICVLPWVHEFRDIPDAIAPCCWAENLPKGKTIADVRQSMLNNIKPKACQVCYKSEKESNFSYRIQETTSWVKKFGEPDIQNPLLQFLDIRYDPTCNLKCKTCGPDASTLWQKEKNVSIAINLNNQKYIHQVDKKILKKVLLTGGEPTYIKDYLDFLNELLIITIQPQRAGIRGQCPQVLFNFCLS